MNPYVQNQQKMAQESLGKMKRLNSFVSSAKIGIGITKNCVIFHASSYAEKFGLKPGDKIIAINNEEINKQEDIIRLIRMNKVGDSVTLRILRNNSDLDITAKTYDGKREDDLLKSTYEAIVDGNWKLCIQEARSLIDNDKSLLNYDLLLQCLSCERITKKRRPNNDEATLVYDAGRIAIKELAYDPLLFDSIRSSIISKVDWLNRNDFKALGNDLQKLFDEADRSSKKLIRENEEEKL
jgi:bifunctional DNA-binding transcriptional regulator/antitoxin component of YhaV-PrlF toxin-antitoxin module